MRQLHLDGLRGVAVLMVLGYHFSILGRVSGGIGVTIFFVLSGYLITGILLRRPKLTHFYARRARRLLPALYVLLALGFLLRLAWNGPGTWPGYLSVAVYLPGSFGTLPLELDHLWTLGVEEQFYVLWPLALFALLRLGGQRAALWGACLGVVAFNALRWWMWWHGGNQDYWSLYGTLPGRADELLIGAALALLPAVPERLRFPLWIPALGIAAICVAATTYQAAGYELVGETFAALLAAVAVAGTRHRILEHPLLVHFGRISYGLYIWSGALNAYLYHTQIWGATDAPTVLRTVLLGGITWAVAILSYELLERHFTGAPSVFRRRERCRTSYPALVTGSSTP